MPGHTQPYLDQPNEQRVHLTDGELRALMRFHVESMMEQLPPFNEGLVDVSVELLTQRIEPHLKRISELFTLLKHQTEQH